MSNHIHLLLAGPEADVRALFALFRKRLARYLSGQGVYAPLRRFEASLFLVPDLQVLRDEIIYINRNGYEVHPECTPYSYPWSAAPAFFNPWMSLLPTTPFSALTVQERRTLCRCREAVLPEHYRVFRGALFPASFCAIGEAESLFPGCPPVFPAPQPGSRSLFRSRREIADGNTDSRFPSAK